MTSKTEDELIATVTSLTEIAACVRFAERAKKAGMSRLAVACDSRAQQLGARRTPRAAKDVRRRDHAVSSTMKTHVVAEMAIKFLEEDYFAGLPATTYGQLAARCGFARQPIRWFGQVTDLIDAACALSDVPSFALVRVLDSNLSINPEAG